MIQQHHDELEGDGMDPGLGELAYDGTEYEYDEFAERIGSDDLTDDMAQDEASVDSAGTAPVSTDGVEKGFGETLNADTNPHLVDQLEDDRLNQQAEADYTDPDSMAQEEIPKNYS